MRGLQSDPKPQGNEKYGWVVVQGKRKKSKRSTNGAEYHTIFMYHIPNEVSAKEMWNCLRNTGTILDIILPKKKTKGTEELVLSRLYPN